MAAKGSVLDCDFRGGGEGRCWAGGAGGRGGDGGSAAPKNGLESIIRKWSSKAVLTSESFHGICY